MLNSLEYLPLALNLAILYFAWKFGVRNYFLAKYRQKLFTIRDSMFDEAHNGNLSFDSLAYRMMRLRINGAIRRAHRLTPIDLLVIGFHRKAFMNLANNESNILKQAISSENNKAAQEYLEEVKDQVDMLTAVFMIKANPFMWVISLVLIVVGILKGCSKIFKTAYNLKNWQKVVEKSHNYDMTDHFVAPPVFVNVAGRLVAKSTLEERSYRQLIPA